MTKSTLLSSIDLNTSAGSMNLVPTQGRDLDSSVCASANSTLSSSSLNSSTASAGSNGKRRRSRASDTLLLVASAVLKMLGVKAATSQQKGAGAVERKSRRRKDKESLKTNSKQKIEINGHTEKMPGMSVQLTDRSYSVLKSLSMPEPDTAMGPTEARNYLADQQPQSDVMLMPHRQIVQMHQHDRHYPYLMPSVGAVATTSTAAAPLTIPTATTTTTSSSSSPTSSSSSSTTTTTSTTTSSTTSNRLSSAAAGTTTTTNTKNPSSTSSTASTTVPARRSANDYRFGKAIGEGSFSTVYLAKDIHSNKEVAIKVCEKQHIIREGKQEYIKREREALNLLSNYPGFVNLSCTFQDTRSLYFVMTYAKNGDLLPHITKVGSFDLNLTKFYAAELVLALELMHKNGVIHRDLKPENILLDENMHILLADFGSAKIINKDELAKQNNNIINNNKKLNQNQSNNLNNLNNNNNNNSFSNNNNNTNNINNNNSSTRNNNNSNKLNNNNNNHMINNKIKNINKDYNSSSGSGSGGDNNSDSDDEEQRIRNNSRRRRNSFVGTAQYVSPEILKGQPTTKSTDLWALGCIIYQMISNSPPFRAPTEYLIFQKVLNTESQPIEFPLGFDKVAADLVSQLIQFDPSARIGAMDEGDVYSSIRSHPFFHGINWDTLRTQMPPTIYPYLPGSNNDEYRSHYRVPDHLETGLDDRQLTRLLGLELGTSDSQKYAAIDAKNTSDTAVDSRRRQEDKNSDKWLSFVEGETIIKHGFVNKRKGLFARKRVLLLTTGPRLFYIDPVQMVKKGEIPWSPEIRVEPKNFKIFFVHTPNRTYYLEDPEGYALEWCKALDEMRIQTYETASTKSLISNKSK